MRKKQDQVLSAQFSIRWDWARPLLRALAFGCLFLSGIGASAQVTVKVSPTPCTLSVGQSKTFTAAVGGTTNKAVTWTVREAGGGSVTSAGFYRAPSVPGGPYHVRATSKAKTTVYSEALVTVVAAPSISGFTAARSLLTAGGGTTLTAVFTGGVGSIPGLGVVTSGTPIETGALSASTTFILSVTNAVGDTGTQAVYVGVVAAPSIASFSALKPVVTAGSGSTLQAVFSNGTGTVAGLGAVTSGSPFATGALTSSKSFVLTVTNAAGDVVTQAVPVSVVAAPAIGSFSAFKKLITAGSSSSLLAVFTDGTGTIAGLGPIVSGAAIQTGNLTASRDFVLTVTNAAGDTSSQTLNVATVAAPSITTFIAAKSPVTTGKATSLTATFEGGTGSIEGLGPVVSGAAIPTGNLTASRDFVLTVTNAAGDSTSQTLNVATVAAPSITTFTAAKSPVTTGKATSLTATFEGGTGAIEGLGPVVSGAAIPTGNLTASRDFVLTVTNAAGDSASQTLNVAIVAAPSITTFTAAKSPVTTGKATSLTATFEGGTGAIEGLGPVVSGAAIPTGNLTAARDFVLTVTNAAGDSTTQTVTVTAVATPSITSFAVANNPITAGTSTTLTAVFSVGTAAIQGVGAVTSGTPIATGSLATASDFVLTVTNTAGDSVTQIVSIVTLPAPVITRFTSSLSQIFPGQSLQLTANFTGGTGRVDQGLGVLSSGSSISVSPPATTTYTLIVTNPIGDSASANVLVNVNLNPFSITSFTCTNPVVDYGASAELDWSVSGCPTSLTLNGASVLGDPAYHTVFPVRRSAYTLAGSNPLGSDTKTLGVAARGLDILAGLVGGNGFADGKGPQARFNGPTGSAIDAQGNLYVADSSNHVIRRIDPVGNVVNWAGVAGMLGSANGPRLSASFYYPRALAFDASGNLYVAEQSGQTIRKIDVAGNVTTVAGSWNSHGSADGVGSAARFFNPSGIAVGPSGDVYVADTGNYVIRRISPSGTVSTFAGLAGNSGSTDGPTAAARFNNPYALTFDGSGNLFVADTNNYTIRRIDTAGNVSTFAGLPGGFGGADGIGAAARFANVVAIICDTDGNLWTADNVGATIRKITPSAVVTTMAGSYNVWGSKDGQGTAARFYGPCGLAMGSGGNLFISDAGNNEIRILDSQARVSTLAGLAGGSGSTNGSAVDARFNSPYGLACDASGNTYLADTVNHAIRKIDTAGNVTTLAGLPGTSGSADGSGTAARFYLPYSLTLDASGNIYVADSCNYTIRKITPAGVVTTLAGLAGTKGTADGTGSAARFYVPGGIAFDGVNSLIVADTSNHAIRKVSLAGVVSSLAGSAGVSGSTDGPAMQARFYLPYGVAADGAGNVFVSDTYNMAIRKIDAAGNVTTLAGLPGTYGSIDGQGTLARFWQPRGVTVDGSGNVFVADYKNHAIRKIDGAGNVTTLVGVLGKNGAFPGPMPAGLASPWGLACTPSGDILVTTTNGLMQVTAP